MAPKSGPPQAKQALVLTWLRSSCSAHTLKDLEKILPSVASINGMQVKDYLQALSDEGQIRVEKIGSGNWYWSFPSEAKKAKEAVLSALQEEYHTIESAMGELKSKIEDAEVVAGESEAGERQELMERQARGNEEVETLKVELESYSECDPATVIRKKHEIEAFKVKAQRWTDNIYCLEEYLKEVTGGDREALERIREEYYGTEYVAGEGLKEI
ncbi:MAG: hypothetical protein MMC33_000477 [Icmadophila ericetorum]|nr:hypothetical protein [Icmadophila ericetorum]